MAIGLGLGVELGLRLDSYSGSKPCLPGSWKQHLVRSAVALQWERG